MSEHIAVVGGGPAGLMAAETLAASGAKVTVFEHKRTVGRKFLLAGRGGLNITHSEPIVDFLDRYHDAGPQLVAAIRSFTPGHLREWCSGHGEPTFIGTSGRVFPESFRATPLLRSWLRRLDDLDVTIETRHRWVGWSDDRSLRFVTSVGDERLVAPAAAVFALGGASWPRVGSDGAWAPTLQADGVTVRPLVAANCGVNVAWSDMLKDKFAGKPIKNTVFTSGGRSVRGDAVVTETGLEGGPIYALGPELRSGSDLVLDTQPDLTTDALTQRLTKRRAKATITSWLRACGIDRVLVALLREATRNVVPADPAATAALLKTLPIRVESMASIERAISTAGGVSFDEIDDNFMLRTRPGTFVAGEMLDWEAPTGGYLLQACFSSGVAAANGALAWLQGQPGD